MAIEEIVNSTANLIQTNGESIITFGIIGAAYASLIGAFVVPFYVSNAAMNFEDESRSRLSAGKNSSIFLSAASSIRKYGIRGVFKEHHYSDYPEIYGLKR